MTKISKKTTAKNVHMHIPENIRVFLDNHLPKTYTDGALNILKQQGFKTTSGVIRNVRSGISKNNKILNVLVKIAEENKKLQDEVISIVDNQ